MVGCDPSEDEEDDERLPSPVAGNATCDGCEVEASISSTGGVGGCTYNLVDGVELANTAMQESEIDCIWRGRADEDEDILRGIDGSGDPALLEFRENSMIWGNVGCISIVVQTDELIGVGGYRVPGAKKVVSAGLAGGKTKR